MPVTDRYYLTVGSGPERRVERGEWLAAARSGGFEEPGRLPMSFCAGQTTGRREHVLPKRTEAPR
ncbi:MAG: hypothetical protein ACLQFR_17350 [Streptosporangiaceae bacterium]